MLAVYSVQVMDLAEGHVAALRYMQVWICVYHSVTLSVYAVLMFISLAIIRIALLNFLRCSFAFAFARVSLAPLLVCTVASCLGFALLHRLPWWVWVNGVQAPVAADGGAAGGAAGGAGHGEYSVFNLGTGRGFSVIEMVRLRVWAGCVADWLCGLALAAASR